MYPPIFATCKAVAGVTAVLGSSPTRLWPFDEAPQSADPLYGLPYAAWQTVGGDPENYLDKAPDIDAFTLQVDVYGKTADSARDAAKALRDAIEPHAHIVAWLGESREQDTRLYRYTFQVDWFVPR